MYVVVLWVVFMSLQVASNKNKTPIVVQSKASGYKTSGQPAFKSHENEQPAPTNVKLGVFATTLAGVCAAMFMTFRKNPSANFKSFKKLGDIKDFIMAFKKIKYDDKTDELAWTVAKLGIGSVGGGLLGGAIFDKKENLKAKIRESVIQLVGNIGVPLLCVAGGGKLFEKHLAPKLIDLCKLKNFKWDKAEKIPQIIAQTGLLITGIFAGNSLGNVINKTFFNVDEKRKIKLTDMSPHIDDVCVSSSLVFKDIELITKFVPPALMIAGYSAGTAQESPSRIEEQKIKTAEKIAIKQHKALEKLASKNNA